MNQFAEMANYRWHYDVTGAAAAEAVEALGAGRPAAFVSAMGSSGTIAAGDALKARFGARDRRPRADPVPDALAERLRRPRDRGDRRQARHVDPQRA